MSIKEKFKIWARGPRPIWATLEEWAVIEDDRKINYPIRYFLFDTMRIYLRVWKRSIFYNPIRWIKYRTVDKYHIVNTGLKPSYYDIDHRMLHANFSLLVDYVEIECAIMELCNLNHNKKLNGRNSYHGLNYLFWETKLQDSPIQAKAALEIIDLYAWWIFERPNRNSPEDKMYDEDTKMLVRLMKIRKHLWS